MILINIFLFLLFISQINQISCLSRGLYLGKEKCFNDHYYSRMNIVINYKILDKDIKLSSSHKSIFYVTLMGFEKNDFKTFYGSKLSGKFAYNIVESDKYQICIRTTDKELFNNKKFLHLEFKVQTTDELYDESSAKAKDFQKVNITMRNIDSKVESIEVMQKYQLELEDEFSKNQIKSSSRLAFISVCQIVVICIVGIYHDFSLRKIFKDKIWTPF